MRRREAWFWFVLACLCRCAFIDAAPLWLDETFSLHMAAKPLATMLPELYAGDIHPPLFYVGLHYWLKLVPAEALWVRLPQALAGAGSVLGFALLLERLSGLQVARCFALLASVSHYLLLFEQECRMYPWVSLAAAGYLLSLDFLRTTRSWRWALAVPGWAWLGAYSDYRFGLCAALGGSFYLLWSRAERRMLLALAVGALGCLPLVPWLAQQNGPQGQGTSLALCHQPVNAHTLAELLPALSGAWYADWPFAAQALFSLAVLIVLVRTCLLKPWDPGRLLGFWLLVAQAGIIVAYSLLRSTIYSVHGSHSLSYPFLMALAGALALAPRPLRWTGLALWLAFNLSSQVSTLLRPDLAKQRWPEVVARLEQALQAGDRLVVLPAFQQVPLQFYWKSPLTPIPLNPVDLTDPRLQDLVRRSPRIVWVLAGDRVVDRQGFVENWLRQNLLVTHYWEFPQAPFHEICGSSTRVLVTVPRLK